MPDETTAVTEARDALWRLMVPKETNLGLAESQSAALDAFEVAVRAEERTAQCGFDRTAEHSQHFGAPSEPSEQEIERAAEAMWAEHYGPDALSWIEAQQDNSSRMKVAETRREARAALQAVRGLGWLLMCAGLSIAFQLRIGGLAIAVYGALIATGVLLAK